jgi:hypothetical protein
LSGGFHLDPATMSNTFEPAGRYLFGTWGVSLKI